MPPKNKGRNKNTKLFEYVEPNDAQYLAYITKNQGNGYSVEKIHDNVIAHCSVRGKLKKKIRFKNKDLVLIQSMGSNKWEIIHKYDAKHKERLQNEGFLDVIVQEESEDEEEEEEELMFESDVKTNEKVVEPNANFIDDI